MDAYEIRLELLKMAYDIVRGNVDALNQWCLMEHEGKMEEWRISNKPNRLVPIPSKMHYAQVEGILAIVEPLNHFVSINKKIV